MLFVVGILLPNFSLSAASTIGGLLILLGCGLTIVGLGFAITAIAIAKSAPSQSVVPRAVVGLILNGLIAIPLINQLLQAVSRGALEFLGF
ncbi:MAG: hypothetical protein ACI9UA_004003 [Pseudoalteromonas tetraodonis]|jgi:hypothetical protein